MGVLFKSFPLNTQGRDFAVGDIHGYFSLLEKALAAVNFDPTKDRLYSVGDLVDRGPESDRFMEFLAYPWFKAERGNHEQMVIDALLDPWWANTWYKNGGVWGWVQGPEAASVWAQALDELPIAMEVMTPKGKVGLMHANPVLSSWDKIRNYLETVEKTLPRPFSMDTFPKPLQDMIWSRDRLYDMASAVALEEPYDNFPGVTALVLGHTIVRQPFKAGNIWAIDTGAYQETPEESALTLLNLHTFEVHRTFSATPATVEVAPIETP